MFYQHVAPLYLGLARPPMIAGVSYMYFTLNMMVMMIGFINSADFSAFLFGFVMHGFGYLLCMKEPRAVELWMLRMRYGYTSWNRMYHSHTNSYDVF